MSSYFRSPTGSSTSSRTPVSAGRSAEIKEAEGETTQGDLLRARRAAHLDGSPGSGTGMTTSPGSGMTSESSPGLSPTSPGTAGKSTRGRSSFNFLWK